MNVSFRLAWDFLLGNMTVTPSLIYNDSFFLVCLGFPIGEYDGNARFNLPAAGQVKGLGSQLKLNFQGVIEKYQKSTKSLGSPKLCPILPN